MPRRSAFLRWLVAALLVAACGVGLRDYRVDNAVLPDDSASFVIAAFRVTDSTAATIAANLRRAPGVSMVIDPATTRAARPLTGVAPEGLVVGRDGVVGLLVFRDEAIDDDALVRLVDDACESAGVHAALAGPAAFHAALNEASQRGLGAIVGAMMFVGFALTAWLARSVAIAAATVAALSMAQVALLGAASWLGVPMSMSLSLVPPMMLAFGYSYAIHRATAGAGAASLLWCAATTGAGVASFALVDSPVTRAFGVWGLLGVVLTAGAVILLLPRRTCEPRLRFAPTRRTPGRRAAIVAATALVALGGLAAAPGLRVSENPLALFPADAPIVRDSAFIEANLTGCLPFDIVTEGGFDPSGTLREWPGVRAVVPLDAIGMSPDRASSRWWCLADNDALSGLRALEARLSSEASVVRAEAQLAGVGADVLRLAGAVEQTAAWSIPTMVMVAFVSTALAARSLCWGLAGASVNALPLVVVAALAFGGHALTIADLFVGGVLVGASMDDTLHLAMGRRRSGSLDAALARAAPACAASTLVVCVCAACFLFSGFPPTRMFGALLASGLAIALAGDLLALPALVGQRR